MGIEENAIENHPFFGLFIDMLWDVLWESMERPVGYVTGISMLLSIGDMT